MNGTIHRKTKYPIKDTMTKYIFAILAVFALGITQKVLAESENETSTYEVTMTGVT